MQYLCEDSGSLLTAAQINYMLYALIKMNQ